MSQHEQAPSGLGPVLALAALLVLLCLGLVFLLLPPDLMVHSPRLGVSPPPAPAGSGSGGSGPVVASQAEFVASGSSADGPAAGASEIPSRTESRASGSGSAPAPSDGSAEGASISPSPSSSISTLTDPPPLPEPAPPLRNTSPPPSEDPDPDPDPGTEPEQDPEPDGPSVSFLGGPLDRLDEGRERVEPPPPIPPDLALAGLLPTDGAEQAGPSSSATGGSTGPASGTTGGAPRSGEVDAEGDGDGDSLVPGDPPGPKRVAPSIRSAAAKAADRSRPEAGPDPYVDPVDWRDVPPWRQTKFFNIRAEGSFFAFVVDCSGSMDDDFRLFRAKRELRRAIDAMRTPQRYSIVFFNDRTIPMADGVPRSADPKEKRATFSWLDSISADGGTDPREAMTLALGLQPDAIFLLTDGEFPNGTDELLISNNPRGIPIHCINLGTLLGAGQLRSIAGSSGGRYAAPR